MPGSAETNEDQLELLRAEWQPMHRPEEWDDSFARLIDEWRSVEWQSGGKTLLAAMGLQYSEVSLCRGLAWLLDAEGGHRLGRHLVVAFLADLGLPDITDTPVTIQVEESRADTRADIVVRVGGHTVVIEAKVHAGEQFQQADRLWTHWEDEHLTLVFLTRTGYRPFTAKKSDGQWLARTWRDVAQLAHQIIVEAKIEPSAGAREFIETIGAL